MGPKRKATSQLGESNSKKKKIKDEHSHTKWTSPHQHLYVYCHPGQEANSKIAAFDLDCTLIKPKGKNKWPKGRNDWTYLYGEKTIDALKQLHEDGFKIVIFTNQGGIEKNRTSPSEIMGKIDDIIEDLGLPINALIAGATDKYRKPHTGMWDYFIEHMNGGVKADLTVSFFCGDAAGRIDGWKPGMKKDFSNVDRSFAYNLGLTFKTPEEYFLLEEESKDYHLPSLEIIKKFGTIDEGVKHDYSELFKDDSQEVVILVGQPASGKSTFCKKYLLPKGYVHINRDTLKNKAKCQKLFKEALEEKKSVVVDNTNPDRATREEYIKIAKSFNVPVRCFHFNVERSLSHHLNMLREAYQDVRRIPDVGFNTFYSRFNEPSKAEGFDSVVVLEFKPDFENEKHKELFMKSYVS